MIWTLFVLTSLAGLASSQLSQTQLDIFKDLNVTITDDPNQPQKYYKFEHHGIPHHDYGPFPNKHNPNDVTAQNHIFQIPKQPVKAATPGCLRMGAIAVAINGVPIYNPYTSQGFNAVDGDKKEVMDKCNGHPQQRGAYHYHAMPNCTYTGKADELVGVAFDGYPIYGPKLSNGTILRSKNLDACHGREVNGKYEYRVTADFPYVIGCYYGEVATVKRPPPPGRKKRQLTSSGSFAPDSCLYVTFCEHPGASAGCPDAATTWDPNAYAKLLNSTSSSTSGSGSSTSGSGSSTSGSGSSTSGNGTLTSGSGSSTSGNGTSISGGGSIMIRPSASGGNRYQCGNGLIWCLETGKCVNDDADADCEVPQPPPVNGGGGSGSWSRPAGAKCGPGEIWCLETGRCVTDDADAGCVEPQQPPVSGGGGSGSWSRPQGTKCGLGEIYCTETSKCVAMDADADCDPNPACKKNLVFEKCAKCDRTCGDPKPTCLSSTTCTAKCTCPTQAPILHNGSCIAFTECPAVPTCKENLVFEKCAKCDRTCGDPKPTCLSSTTCTAKCTCPTQAPILHNGSCIAFTECPAIPTCKKNLVFEKCAKCDRTCGDPKPTCLSSTTCTAKCTCPTQAPILHNGSCIAFTECPAVPTCKENLVFEKCAKCDRTCGDPKPTCLSSTTCTAKCTCPTQAPILHNGSCIAFTECPAIPTCKENLVFEKCAKCDRTCGDPKPTCLSSTTCTAKCTCPTQAPILHNGSCIAFTECPAVPTCKENLVFEKCAKCDRTCGDPKPTCLSSTTCTAKCTCPTQAPILHNGSCIAFTECPAVPTCKENLVFEKCAKCDRTCGDPKPTCLSSTTCTAKCTCPTQAPILHNGRCIAFTECPALPTCTENLVFEKCAKCDKTCREPNPTCTAACTEKCTCPTQTPIIDNGKCITLAECPAVSKVGQCPVVIQSQVKIACTATCRSDGNCPNTQKCCSNENNCKVCMPVDDFALPLVCEAQPIKGFGENLIQTHKLIIKGNKLQVRLGLTVDSSSAGSLTFQYYDLQKTSYQPLLKGQGLRLFDVVLFKFSGKGPATGFHKAVLSIMKVNPDKTLTFLRRYPMTIMHFSENEKPSIALAAGASNTLVTDEDATLSFSKVESLFKVDDPAMPDYTAKMFVDKITLLTHAEMCIKKYQEYVKSTGPLPQQAVYIVPHPKPTTFLKGKLAVKKTIRGIDTMKTLFSLGGLVYENEELVFIPAKDFSGEISYMAWPVDGQRSKLSAILTSKSYGIAEWNNREKLLKASAQVGKPMMFTVKVTAKADVPEVSASLFRDFAFGNKDATDVMPTSIPFDISGTQTEILASDLVAPYFKGDGNALLALVYADNSQGKWEVDLGGKGVYTALSTKVQRRKRSTIVSLVDVLSPKSLTLLFRRIMKEGLDAVKKEYAGHCNAGSSNITKATILPAGTKLRFTPKDLTDFSVSASLAFTSYNPAAAPPGTTYPTDVDMCVPLCANKTLCGGTTGLAEIVIPSQLLRKGCDGVPGSGKILDVCGECGGDGKNCYRDCKGDINGMARTLCDACVDLQTLMDPQKLLSYFNCKGICKNVGGNYTNKDTPIYDRQNPSNKAKTKEQCMGDTVDPTKFAKSQGFCDGYLLSPAVKLCGQCVGGHSGKTKSDVLDVCGVCNGNGSTCKDCAEVPNGKKMTDRCGQCLLKSDPNWDKSCSVALGDFSVKKVWMHASVETIVEVAGSEKTNTIECKLAYNQIEVPITATVAYVTNTKQILKVKTPTKADVATLITGAYKLKCKVNGASATIESKGSLDLFDNLDATAITPSTFVKGDKIQGKVTGKNFSPSVRMFVMCPPRGNALFYSIRHCLLGAKEYGGYILAEVPLNVTAIKATEFPLTIGIKAMSMVIKLVGFHGKPSSNAEVAAARQLTVTIQSKAPEVVGIDFSYSLCDLHVQFDMNVEANNNQQGCIIGYNQDFVQCCKDIFEAATLAKFGTGAECKFDTRRQLIISLRKKGVSLKSGDTIRFNAQSIRERNVDPKMAVYPSVVEYTIQSQWLSKKPKVSVSVPRVVGSCDEIKIRTKVFGPQGCGMITSYKWSIAFKDQQAIDPNKATHLTAVNMLNEVTKYLAQITGPTVTVPGDKLAPGFEYSFTVTFTNGLNVKSYPVTRTINKTEEKTPFMLQLRTKQEIDPVLNAMRLKAATKVSQCFESQVDYFQYSYSILNSAETFGLETFKQSFAIIKPNQLQGGKTYKLQAKVIAVLKNQLEVTKIAEAEVTTLSKPVQAVITGLYNHSVVSKSQEISFDGSKSKDPNNPNGQYNYNWQCNKFDSSAKTWDICRDEINQIDLTSSVLGYTSSITLPKDTLSIGSYEFTLKVTSQSRIGQESIRIEVVTNGVPSITIVAAPTSLVNYESLFKLVAKVCASTNSTTEIIWRAVQENGYNLLNTVDGNCKRGHELFTKPSDVECTFFPLICKGLEPNSIYQFEVIATNTTNGVSSKQNITVDVETAPIPPKAEVTVSPINGTAMETKFEIEAVTYDDGDVLTYHFFFKSDDGRIVSLQSRKEVTNTLTALLPKGTGYIVVKVCSIKSKLCTKTQSSKVTVTADDCLTLTKTKVEALLSGKSDPLAFLRNLLQSCGISLAYGTDSNGNALDQALIDFIKEKKDQFTISQLSTTSKTDVESSIEEVKYITALTKENDDALTTEVKDVFLQIINDLSKTSSGGNKRKKRAASNPSQTMDANHVSTLLESYSVTFKNQTDSQLVKSEVTDFINNLDTYMTGLCNGLVLNDLPIVIQEEIACMTADKRRFSGIHNETLSIGNCSAYITKDAMVKLQSELANQYSVWTCDTNTQCEGACISSYQLNRDMLTITSNQPAPLMSTRRSHILNLVLINPQTGVHLSVSNLATPVEVVMPLEGVVDLSQHSIVCRQFVGGDWLQNSCNVTSTVTASSTEVTCSCDRLAAVSLFEDAAVVSTTPVIVAPTQAAAPAAAATTAVPANNPTPSTGTTSAATTSTSGSTTISISGGAVGVTSQFSFTADQSSVIGTGASQTAFIDSLRNQIAAAMYVTPDRITDLTVTSGTAVSFKLNKADSGTSLSAAVQALQNGISNGSLALTYQNQSLPLVASSFTGSEITTQAPTTTTTQAPVAATSNNMPLIIGCAAGALVLLVIVIIVAVLVIKAKSNNGKVMTPEQTPRRHHDVVSPPPAYTSPVNGSDKPRSPAQLEPTYTNYSKGSRINTPIGGSPEPDGMPPM